jgi:hypothetical protein
MLGIQMQGSFFLNGRTQTKTGLQSQLGRVN